MNAKEITKELVAKGYPTDPQRLGTLIAAYLLKEQERCAKIADKMFDKYGCDIAVKIREQQ